AETLKAAGYLEQRGRQWVLTPQAIRKIAQRALAEVLGQLRRDRPGRHRVDARGAGGDPTDESKAYEFGDPFLLDLRETLGSAIRRRGAGLPLRREPGDFNVRRTELSTRCATALLLDMSRSMIYRGCWTAAKKVALALHALIRAQYPQDALYVIGFSLYARQLDPDEVPTVVLTDRHYGTNMQHALQLARQLLARHRGGNRQVLMITDGEPTAHLEGSEAYFDYPPTRRTWQLTHAHALRARGRHHQHVHARGQPRTSSLRQRDVADQPRARVLRPARPAGRVRPRGLPRPETEARRVTGAARLQTLLDDGVAAGVFPCAAAGALPPGPPTLPGA